VRTARRFSRRRERRATRAKQRHDDASIDGTALVSSNNAIPFGIAPHQRRTRQQNTKRRSAAHLAPVADRGVAVAPQRMPELHCYAPMDTLFHQTFRPTLAIVGSRQTIRAR
jgi:hypothetical protein